MSPAVPAQALMSIGEVLAALRPDFQDITISKIRFLEEQGLIEPQRTASGYRKFSHQDVNRLRYVLAAQRDHYLPLRVIREHLEAMDRGLEPPELPGGGPRVPLSVISADGYPSAAAFGRDNVELRLSREELLEAAAIDEKSFAKLEEFGLVTPSAGGRHFDSDALVIARTVAEMAGYGIEARHLRAVKAAADREVGLVEQVVVPLRRQRNPEARARADEVVRELAALSVRLHATLVKSALASGSGR
jgi:DNA-binding transcriptional MerR regulator